MLVYPKIAREAVSPQAVFMAGCGCDLKTGSGHAGFWLHS